MASSSFLSTFLLLLLLFHFSDAAVFNIRNNCPYTVWAGAVPGGGRQLNPGQTWSLNVPVGTSQARIWPRTGCNFDGSGRGRCQTDDCNGLLACQNFGQPPNTLAEYALNQFSNLDFFDISLVDGFNVPMEFSPNSGGCTRGIRCTADINGQCPSSYGLLEGVITLALCLRQIITVVTLETVDQLNFQDFSRLDALMLIAIPRMTHQARLLVLVEPTIGLFFVHEDV